MLKSELGQDLCGWGEEILFRFQVWQDLGIDSGKEKKIVDNPLCLLRRADPGNHGICCLVSRKPTSSVLQLLAK